MADSLGKGDCAKLANELGEGDDGPIEWNLLGRVGQESGPRTRPAFHLRRCH
jgi:hypothetical protein